MTREDIEFICMVLYCIVCLLSSIIALIALYYYEKGDK